MNTQPSKFNKWMYLLAVVALIVIYLDVMVWRPG